MSYKGTDLSTVTVCELNLELGLDSRQKCRDEMVNYYKEL